MTEDKSKGLKGTRDAIESFVLRRFACENLGNMLDTCFNLELHRIFES